MKFYNPRNVKKGLDFLGLDVKGWLLFFPTVVVFGGAALLFIPILKLKIILICLIFGLSYILFQVNENTGAMNVHFVAEFINWLRSEKSVDIYWVEHDKYQSLKMKVKGFDRETLEAYRMYKASEGGIYNVGLTEQEKE